MSLADPQCSDLTADQKEYTRQLSSWRPAYGVLRYVQRTGRQPAGHTTREHAKVHGPGELLHTLHPFNCLSLSWTSRVNAVMLH